MGLFVNAHIIIIMNTHCRDEPVVCVHICVQLSACVSVNIRTASRVL